MRARNQLSGFSKERLMPSSVNRHAGSTRLQGDLTGRRGAIPTPMRSSRRYWQRGRRNGWRGRERGCCPASDAFAVGRSSAREDAAASRAEQVVVLRVVAVRVSIAVGVKSLCCW